MIKKIVKDILPDKCIYLLRKMVYNFDREKKIRLFNNKKFENIHRGKRCFIIGNGPSIKEQELSLLKDEYTFTVNQLPRMNCFNKINSTYHIWADERFFDIDLDKQEDRELLDVMKSVKTENNNPIIFYKMAGYSMIKKYRLDEEMDICYYDEMSIDVRKYKGKISMASVMPSFSTVIQYAICMAVYMGFSEIYLLGCDCTGIITTIQAKSKSWGDNIEYAYNVSENEKKRMEKSNQKHTIKEELIFYANIFEQYENLYEYCKKNNVKLYNATRGGVLESIPRVNFEELF